MMRDRFLATWQAPRGYVLEPAEMALTLAVFAGEEVNAGALAALTERLEAAPVVT